MLENAHQRGLQLMQGLLDIINAHDFPIIDVRGKGLMVCWSFAVCGEAFNPTRISVLC
jgi:4-aminobutyrate aminotransferase-like enzyme